MDSRTGYGWKRWSKVVALAALALVAAATNSVWWPPLSRLIDRSLTKASETGEAEREAAGHSHGDEHHAEHDAHDHGGHDESMSIELSPQALKNLGLTAEYLKPIGLGEYRRKISVPAIVAARPGRTQVRVSSPLSGVVTHVHAVPGEAVVAGHLLFEVRLTYEDLVETQTQFLKSLSELEVETREIARLDELTQSGAVSGKLLLERRYAKEKLEAFLGSMREGLKLHGLSATQIATIEKERKLLRDLAIEAPDIDSHAGHEELRLSGMPFQAVSYDSSSEKAGRHPTRPLIVEDLRVQKGQGITSGEMLCTLSDFSQLYIEGQAFEQDAPSVATAAERGWAIDATFPTATGQEQISNLKLVFVGNSVDEESRTLSFYVELPNQIVRDETSDDHQRFITWKYRIGQRLQLQVPVEVWEEQIVLPVDAVVKEGADWFVFRQNGDHFDRVAVHVKYRDPRSIVIDNDGALFPGDVVAWKSAHQLQMALKNQSGAGVDAHAGHSH